MQPYILKILPFACFVIVVMLLMLRNRNKSKKKEEQTEKGPSNPSRRQFLTFAATLAHDEGMQALQGKVNKGVAVVTGKRNPVSKLFVIPAGAQSFQQYKDKCNTCMKCVQVCPEHILEPGLKLGQGMMPKLSFQNGYCHPDCVKCNDVCETGALTKITPEQKKEIQIGHAIWVRENCIAAQGETCTKCADACPQKCIEMVKNGRKSYPIITAVECTGCGACEWACVAAPLKGIYVEAFAEHAEGEW